VAAFAGAAFGPEMAISEYPNTNESMNNLK
jgi:hypothetical protein